MLKRWTLICITFIMFLAAMSTDFVCLAKQYGMVEHMMIDFESIDATDDFMPLIENFDVQYKSEETKIKIVDADMALLGKKSMAVNKANLSFENISVTGDNIYVDMTIRADAKFNNNMSVSISSLQPSKSQEYIKDIELFSFHKNKKDNTNVITDINDKVLFVAQDNVRYYVRCVFLRGLNTFDIYIDDTLIAEKCQIESSVYTLEDLNIDVQDLSKNKNDDEDVVNSYVLIDNICIYTKGYVYPQSFSSQKIGTLPIIDVPEENKDKSTNVYINDVKISFFYQPVEKNNTIYMDLEQISRCVGITLKEDKSSKQFELSNENIKVKASIDSKNIEINGKKYAIAKAPEKINGTIYVSPNFLSEVFNAKVWWDKNANTVVITTGKYKNDNILRVVGGKFYMNGEPYYEISFNKSDLLNKILKAYEKEKTDEKLLTIIEKELKEIKEAGMDTVRVSLYSKNHNDILYNNASREKYFKAVDEMFELLKKNEIQAVVTLELTKDFVLKNEYIDSEGWIPGIETSSDIVAFSDCESRENVYSFIDMVVTRYKDSNCVLMWEIDDSLNLIADTGANTKRVTFSLLQLSEFYSDCANRIKKNDSKHLVISGDSILRYNQWNAFKSVMSGSKYSSKTDNLEERMKAIALINKKLDVVSINFDIDNKSVYIDENKNNIKTDLALFVNETEILNKALYVGNITSNIDDKNESYYSDVQRTLNSIIFSNVQLAHWQTTIDADVAQMVVEANSSLKKKYVINEAEEENTTDAWNDFTFSVFNAEKVTNGSEFTEDESLHSKVTRLIILGTSILLVAIIFVIALTGEKIKRKRKDDFVW